VLSQFVVLTSPLNLLKLKVLEFANSIRRLNENPGRWLERGLDVEKSFSSCHLNKQRLINPLAAEVDESARLVESTGVTPPYKISRFHRESQQHEARMVLAKKLWTWRWSLLKKPCNVSGEEKQAITALESEDEGFVHSFRSIIRQLVNIFDHAHSEAQAKLRLHQLRQDIDVLEDRHLDKIPHFLDAHWEQALRYLRKKGMGKHRRGSNSESGMRLLRRLEKNHDGVRSAATRQHYIQIYQAIKYLSLDVADFLEQGPQLAALPDV